MPWQGTPTSFTWRFFRFPNIACFDMFLLSCCSFYAGPCRWWCWIKFRNFIVTCISNSWLLCWSHFLAHCLFYPQLTVFVIPTCFLPCFYHGFFSPVIYFNVVFFRSILVVLFCIFSANFFQHVLDTQRLYIIACMYTKQQFPYTLGILLKARTCSYIPVYAS